jgi:hypothetical protein
MDKFQKPINSEYYVFNFSLEHLFETFFHPDKQEIFSEFRAEVHASLRVKHLLLLSDLNEMERVDKFE